MMFTKLQYAVAIAALGLALSFTTTGAQADFITNGNFTNFTSSGNGSAVGGELGYNTTVTGWTNTNNGYNFLFSSGSADSTGVTGQYGNLQLWGPNNGSANGLPATSPTGTNYIGADGAFNVGAIQQTINGLQVGTNYSVGFWYAAAQQYGFNGPTTDQWKVSLGNQEIDTAVLSISSHGFSGWQYATMTFNATGTSEVLSFLANGTPNGVPPFALLDGVSMTAVPEPASAAMLLTGLAGLGGVVRRRRKAAKTAAE